ncbi:hypothetical protein [Streptomyces coeruleorubidus]|uniref:Uncharacterized protein n=1 Tax=Streptomyces coeruleorubidus TaxID=116188 RepID=A0ABZ0KRI3_STRC4|nr:hypothetical protein [Streptomyces coeruleorubidus]WOT40675.1 hypothetical protein R5U08_42045 [Streptomyces coeruleorubidus]
MTFRETSAFPGWTDWQLAREVLHHARFSDGEERIAERFTEEEVRRVNRYLAGSRPDTARLDAIETRLKAVPDGWRQRDGDAGLIEDADGHPIAILGTSGDVRLPLGEFLADAPDDTRWLAQQLRRAWAQLDKLRDRIDDAGSLMDTCAVETAIGYVRGSRETE